MVALPASLSVRSFPVITACPWHYIHWSYRRWMSTIYTCQSGLRILLFYFFSLFFHFVCLSCCVLVSTVHNYSYVREMITVIIITHRCRPNHMLLTLVRRRTWPLLCTWYKLSEEGKQFHRNVNKSQLSVLSLALASDQNSNAFWNTGAPSKTNSS